MTSEIKPEDVKLPEPAQPRVYFCNKCGHFGAVGPSHVGCDYYATGSGPFFTADQVRAAVLEAKAQERERIAMMAAVNASEAWVRGASREMEMWREFAAAIRAGHSITETPLGEG